MRLNTIESFLCLLVYLTSVDLAKTQAVRYPHLNHGSSCPEDSSGCVPVTSCNTALKNIKQKKNPIVCGWTSQIPLVCCPEEKEEVKPRQHGKISRLSPKGCGLRKIPAPRDDDIVIHPPSPPSGAILESGIEPRQRRDKSKLSVPSLDDINTYTMFAVGGETAKESWPWMVAIFNGNAQKQLCGGTLIDERHVITAAHCFAGRSLDANLYNVQIGQNILREENVVYAVQQIKLHESYQARYYYDDIAIMRLSNPLDNFRAACLPADDAIQHGDNVTVLGWGDLSYGGPSTARLQEVVGIPIVKNSKCDAKFRTLPEAPFPRGITETFLCAGLEEGGRDACQGDSGGPLLQQNPDGPWTLVGVVSFGFRCGEPGYPGVYTKISAYLEWIEKFINRQNEVVRKKSRSQNFEYLDDKPIWPSVTEKVLFPR